MNVPGNLLNSSIINNYSLNAYWYILNPYDSSIILIANSSYTFGQQSNNTNNTNNNVLNILLSQNIWSKYINNQIYCQIYPAYNGVESLISFGYQPYYLGLNIDFIPYSADSYLYNNYDYNTHSVHLVFIFKLIVKIINILLLFLLLLI